MCAGVIDDDTLNGPAHQFLLRLAEVPAEGAVDEGDLELGVDAVDKFGLVLHDAAVAGFAFTQRLIREFRLGYVVCGD